MIACATNATSDAQGPCLRTHTRNCLALTRTKHRLGTFDRFLPSVCVSDGVCALQAFPHSMLKVAGSVPLLGTGLTAKIVYELPFNNVQQFWNPPARLMIRWAGAGNWMQGVQGITSLTTGWHGSF